ncbi:MAG TPA: patatin-like phospholipase family protein [Candidatus Cybelea sp.]|nr:patatin-like phospholipase family protein [Candidatus Cybelea sp.]
MERRSFLTALGASACALPLFGTSVAAAADEPLERALVLSGGGARGAYEAGVIGALAAIAGVRDGSPLPPYQIVCGASIGTLNGWFVATGQYTKLRELWYTVASQNLIQPKSQYAALRDSQSGVLDRAAAAFHLIGLVRNQRALLDSNPVSAWIAREINPATPLLMPLVFAVTNLSLQRPEYFYVRPENQNGDLPKRVTRELQLTLGPHTVVREATPELLHRALFASAALPLAFDPVQIPNPGGTMDEYCDGGVASNSPVGIAHAVSNGADVILLDPPFEPDTSYDDAVEVVFAVYGTMQRKILETEMRNAYFQSVGKRTFAGLAPREMARAEHENPSLAKLMQTLPITQLRYVRPAKVLPLGVVAFDDEASIYEAYRIGWEDGASGFTAYDWETFEL